MKYLLILIFCLPMTVSSQFEMRKRDIKYTDYKTQDKIIQHWENTNQEIDIIEGIYEPIGNADKSVLNYILAIIKVDDYFEIIMLGEGYKSKDVFKGGVKATLKKMPSEISQKIFS